MKILFAHDCLTAYNTIGFLSKILNPFAKCQDKKVEDLLKLGVRGFDIRCRMVNDNPQSCHGLVDYDINIIEVLYKIETYLDEEEQKKVHIRIAHENQFRNSDKDSFTKFTLYLRTLYPQFKYEIIDDKKTWNIIYSDFSERTFECCGSKLVPFVTPKKFAEERNNTLLNMMKRIKNGLFYFDFI